MKEWNEWQLHRMNHCSCYDCRAKAYSRRKIEERLAFLSTIVEQVAVLEAEYDIDIDTAIRLTGLEKTVCVDTTAGPFAYVSFDQPHDKEYHGEYAFA